MRKGKEHQKKSFSGIQLNLFRDIWKPAEESAGGTGTDHSAGDALLSRLKEQRVQTANILERSVDYENLTRAYNQVVSNKGRGGVDGMDINQFRQWLGEHLELLRASLQKGTYEVSNVLKVEIDKPTGGKRMLGIPTVKDRFVQQAIHQKLSSYYDLHFSENSFGFRPNKNAHQAIERASGFIAEEKVWVVDIDLENFFDKINHDRLMTRLSQGVGDKKLLQLINSFLKAGMMEGGLAQERTEGTPQGGPLSPLLSNIVLDELDKELESRGHSFCRYADDCNIYVKSKKAGERVMASVIKFIENKLKLKVNMQKSGVRHCSDVKFLGYTLLPGGDRRVSDKSITRMKDKVREITKRNRGVKFEQVIEELNSMIIGWTDYYFLANKWLEKFSAIDKWIRRKLRCYRLKQCKRTYPTFKFLRSLGVEEGKSWGVVKYSQGWWAMSNKPTVSRAMGLNWFVQQGLHSLYERMKTES